MASRKPPRSISHFSSHEMARCLRAGIFICTRIADDDDEVEVEVEVKVVVALDEDEPLLEATTAIGTVSILLITAHRPTTTLTRRLQPRASVLIDESVPTTTTSNALW
jgi:hypothetical protein